MLKEFIIFLLVIVGNQGFLQQCKHSDSEDCKIDSNDIQEFLPVADNFTSIEVYEDEDGSGSEGAPTIWINLEKPGSHCIEPGFNKICSGKGICDNNTCYCESFIDQPNNISYRYTGKYCEECPYCNGQRCFNFLNCVDCVLNENEAEKCLEKCPFSFQKRDNISRNIDNDEKLCEIEDINGCFIQFKYYYDMENRLFLEIKNQRSCFYGMSIIIYSCWGFLIYLVLLMTLIPRFCPTLEQHKTTSIPQFSAEVIRWDGSDSD